MNELDTFSTYLNTSIRIGDTVVYNLSGVLAIGKVLKIRNKLTRSTFRSTVRWEIHLQHVASSIGYSSDHVSIVKNPEGIYKL